MIKISVAVSLVLCGTTAPEGVGVHNTESASTQADKPHSSHLCLRWRKQHVPPWGHFIRVIVKLSFLK